MEVKKWLGFVKDILSLVKEVLKEKESVLDIGIIKNNV